MPCHSPIPAYRTPGGEVKLWKHAPDSAPLELPCGGCLGCRTSRARHWALRCTLELRDHDQACWATLTYNDDYLPPTLQKQALPGWLKRLRARVPEQRLRFFGSGEYGEQNGRPHYHAILYGISQREEAIIRDCWPYGFSRVDPISPAAIAYVAGYCAKKVGWRLDYHDRECVDPETGEVYRHQPPFVLMSRRPGIGANARKHWQSWRKTAVHNQQEISVPRYLHEAWKAHATDEMKERLTEEKYKDALSRDTTPERREAQKAIAQARHRRNEERRKV